MNSLESYLKTIHQLEYQIALKDQALNVANTLISHLREENSQLKLQIQHKNSYIETSSLISSVVMNKENQEILGNEGMIMNVSSYGRGERNKEKEKEMDIERQKDKNKENQSESQRVKMRNRFRKLLNNNVSCFSNYDSNRMSFNSTKVMDLKRPKSICIEKTKESKIKTIQDDLKELKNKLERKDVEILEIGRRNKEMESKYGKLLETLRDKGGRGFY